MSTKQITAVPEIPLRGLEPRAAKPLVAIRGLTDANYGVIPVTARDAKVAMDTTSHSGARARYARFLDQMTVLRQVMSDRLKTTLSATKEAAFGRRPAFVASPSTPRLES